VTSDVPIPALLGGDPVREDGLPPWPLMSPEIRSAAESAFADGTWGRYHAEHTTELAVQLCEYFDQSHCQLTCSGTAAVELALRGVGVKAGDEVIMSAYDYKPSMTNVLYLGAIPVLVDVLPSNAQIDVSRIEAAITQKTRAVLVSHLHGAMADVIAVREIADRRGIAFVEDVCQMPGALIGDRRAGTFGDVCAISFGGTKTVTVGRGGAVLTHWDAIHQRIHLHANRGNEVYPLSQLQAAMVRPQIADLDAARELRAKRVDEVVAVSKREWIVPFRSTVPDCEPDYYKLGFWYQPELISGLSRDRFVAAMRAEGVPFDVGFRALHLIHARRRYRACGSLENTERADREVVALHHPMFLVDDAAEVVKAALDKVESHAMLLRDAPLAPDEPGLMT